MASPGLSYQDILNAIATLHAQGNKPSINNVRDTIGRGSPTTISKFLKQWRDEQENAVPQNIKQEVLITSKKEENMQPITQATALEKTQANQGKGVTQLNQTQSSDYTHNKVTVTKNTDPMIEALLASSQSLSSDILSSMSDEWSMVLNESNPEIKVRKLYAALVKEQTRRESAEQVAKEARIYAEALKEQTTQRISDLRDALEGQIAFLNGQIRQLKREAEQNLEYYRKQLEKSNNVLAEIKRTR
ncbi:DNA-binding protein [Fastidiosibacter lacustris]|uniref:DNA-binding protein n=1 Tax=Fastidiosibacter lacustris TaxID=2056695 RepID=UPI001864C47A|nr:DNA-binding protein [Fastidiosibacter lacustris]